MQDEQSAIERQVRDILKNCSFVSFPVWADCTTSTPLEVASSVKCLAHSPQSQKNSTLAGAAGPAKLSTANSLPFPRYKKGTWQAGFAHLETMSTILLSAKEPNTAL
jgi:hypothetical protein